MNPTYTTILSLIKSAISGKPAAVPETTDWETVFKLCRSHQIMALVFYGITNSNLEFDLKNDFFEATMAAVLLENQQSIALKEIEDAFVKNNIDYMVLKGSVIKHFYPKPEMRSMSDIDILVKTSQFDSISPIMTKLGYSLKIESDHEYIWLLPPFLNIELHKRLIPSYHSDYYSYFGDGWSRAVKSNESVHKFELTDEDTFIYEVTHLAKHYRDGGIGFRHMVDLWVLKTSKPNMDFSLIEAELDKLELFEFYKNVEKTLENWFLDTPADEITEFLTQKIVSSGSYGTAEGNFAAHAVKKSQTDNGIKNAKRKTIINSIFLPFADMKIKYPILNKAPFLLPFMWVVRWATAVLFKRNHLKTQSQRIKKMDDSVVDEYTAELKKVGLKFNLK